MTTNTITGINYFHTYVEQDPNIDTRYEQHPCYHRIDNCAICGGLNSSDCKMCFDGYVLVELLDDQGLGKHACIDRCPSGYRAVQKFTGFRYCEVCGIENCNGCGVLNVKPTNSSVKAIDLEICFRCQGAHILSKDQSRCIAISALNQSSQPPILNYDVILEAS